MKRGDLVRMEWPMNAQEDRYTGRDFEVVDVVKSGEGPAVVVRDDAGTYRFREASLVKVPGLRAEDVLGQRPRTRRRR